MKVERRGRGMSQGSNQTSIAAGCAVDAIIQSPDETVEHALNVDSFHALGEAGEDNLANVRLSIIVSVPQIQNVRRGTDKDSATVTEHRRRPRQIIREDRALIVDPVAIRILQQADAAQVRDLLLALG